MYHKIKRMLDLFGALLGMVVLAPLFFVIALLIKAGSRGPVFFKQKRVGIHKSYFNVLKFRTMRTDTPAHTPTHLLENPEVYITGIGRILRKTSLDELPQLINILKGDMSFIGPRPALWNQDDLVTLRDRYGANDLLPGLTGWAQINGRDELPIEVKARYDGEYASQIGLAMDMRCFFGTWTAVFKGKGVVEGASSEKPPKDRGES